jgi:hypothetical protein
MASGSNWGALVALDEKSDAVVDLSLMPAQHVPGQSAVLSTTALELEAIVESVRRAVGCRIWLRAEVNRWGVLLYGPA